MRFLFVGICILISLSAIAQSDEYLRQWNDCNGRANNLDSQLNQATSDYLRDEKEFREGYFCSQCMRSASQIEAQEPETFAAHLARVHGYPVPATQEQMNELHQNYLNKWYGIYNNWESTRQDCNSIWNQYQEEKFQESMIKMADDIKNSLPKVQDVKDQINKYKEYENKLYDEDVTGSGAAALTKQITGDKVTNDNFDDVPIQHAEQQPGDVGNDNDPVMDGLEQQVALKWANNVFGEPAVEYVSDLKEKYEQLESDFTSIQNAQNGDLDLNAEKRILSFGPQTDVIKAIQNNAVDKEYSVRQEVYRIMNNTADQLNDFPNSDVPDQNDWNFFKQNSQTANTDTPPANHFYNNRLFQFAATATVAVYLGPEIVLGGFVIKVLKGY